MGFFLLFMGVGGLIIFIPVGVAIYRYQFVRREQAVKTSAYVVDNKVGNKKGEGSLLYYPIISFETEDGTVHEYTSKIGSNPARLRKGSTVTIHYLRDQPHRYFIQAGVVVYGLTILFVLFGVIFFSIGFLGFVMPL